MSDHVDGDTPTPPADAPLPGPVADAVGALRNLGGAFDDEEYDAVADALAAFWRAQQQPALGAETRAQMRENAAWLDELAGYVLDGPLSPGVPGGLRRCAARLLAAAGEP